MNKKIIDLKIYEEDFDYILLGLINNINQTNDLINTNKKLDDDTIKLLKNDIKKEKDLISRLNVCKLYNEN